MCGSLSGTFGPASDNSSGSFDKMDVEAPQQVSGISAHYTHSPAAAEYSRGMGEHSGSVATLLGPGGGGVGAAREMLQESQAGGGRRGW